MDANWQSLKQYEQSSILLKIFDVLNRDILEQNEEKNILFTNFTGLE
jgi:hypothetical protein